MNKKRLTCKEILTVDQVADLLQVNRITVIRHINAGKLSASKIGRSWRIMRGELEAFLNGTDIAS